MRDLHDKYSSQGLAILCFPCNQFGGQEPWPEPEIKEFVVTKMECPNVQLFTRIEIILENAHPLYRWLLNVFPGEITWNFASKFLINREGVPVARFNKGASWEEIGAAIANLLQNKKHERKAPVAKTSPLLYLLPLLLAVLYFYFK